MLNRLHQIVVLFALAAMSATSVFAQTQPTESQSGFVPIDQLPPSEQLPAAPFLIAAYAIVWLFAMFYIWTIWRRVNKLEGEFRALERRAGRGPSR